MAQQDSKFKAAEWIIAILVFIILAPLISGMLVAMGIILLIVAGLYLICFIFGILSK